MNNSVPIICIDGPSGAGKGTLSVSLAHSLNWNLLDSGALYRAVGVACQRSGIVIDNGPQVALFARDLDISFKFHSQKQIVLLDGKDVSSQLRTERAGQVASKIAKYAVVRHALLYWQQDMAKPPGLVADGRDMGTTVFPASILKVFLTASAESRARRRCVQLQGLGENVSLPRLIEAIQERDTRDRHRESSPLSPADDAFLIDSTDLSAHDVYRAVWKLVVSRGLGSETLESRLDPARAKIF